MHSLCAHNHTYTRFPSLSLSLSLSPSLSLTHRNTHTHTQTHTHTCKRVRAPVHEKSDVEGISETAPVLYKARHDTMTTTLPP